MSRPAGVKMNRPLRNKLLGVEQEELILQCIVEASPNKVTIDQIDEWVKTFASEPAVANSTSVKLSTCYKPAKGVWAHVYREQAPRTGAGGLSYLYWFDANGPVRQPATELRWTKNLGARRIQEWAVANPGAVVSVPQLKEDLGYPFTPTALSSVLNWAIREGVVSVVRLKLNQYKSTAPRPLLDTGKRRPMRELVQEMPPVAEPVAVCEHREQYTDCDGTVRCSMCTAEVTGPVEVDHQQTLDMDLPNEWLQSGGHLPPAPAVSAAARPGESFFAWAERVDPPTDTVIMQEVKPARVEPPVETFADTYVVVGFNKAGDAVLRAPDGTLGTFTAI